MELRLERLITAHKLNCGFFIPESFSSRKNFILAERTQSVFTATKACARNVGSNVTTMMMKKIYFLIVIALQSYISHSQIREYKAIINESELKTLLYKAEKGDVDAQIELGNRYYKGYGVVQNYEKSVYWTKKSAEQGLADAQFALAIFYDAGTGVPKDSKKTLYWLEKSASQGNMYAQFQLGGMYFFGDGVVVNKKKGAAWIKKSMDNGNNDAKKKWNEMKLWKYL
jgi:TPR repeat protein